MEILPSFSKGDADVGDIGTSFPTRRLGLGITVPDTLLACADEVIE
jgi:hypothetical protein